ncbi:hypothetical protein V6U81_05740, partial [Micromonospora sp. CPCC 205711]|uniref:HAAS signaling domain-containing protein n=1 Tax=Micromonospora sp. CPCC 205547 TaxID=3122400 RepID=UPI002FEF5236
MTVTGQEITDYVQRVRAALADLPPTVRDELTEDLPEHLTEVAAEADGTLVERLGEPEAYAAELRAAAGAGQPGEAHRGLEHRVAAVARRARVRLSGADARLGPVFGYATASEFLRLLRPAWWVLRGYLAAMFVTGLTTGGTFGVLPRVDGNHVAGLVLLAGLVLGSIWLGRRAAELRPWQRHVLQVVTVGLAIFALVGVVTIDQRARWQGDYGYDPSSVRSPYDQIQDVFVYDSEGRLVSRARLFDQNGTPIRLGWPTCTDPSLPDVNPVQRGYPYCPENAPYRPQSPATAPPPPGTAPTTAAPAPPPSGSAPPGPE